MLENRSFDHLVGFLKTSNAAVAGIVGTESNYSDPNNPAAAPAVAVSRASAFSMPFDPNHEFCDVQKQLFGPDPTGLLCSNPPTDPAAMNGFLYSGNAAAKAAGVPAQGSMVMECFQPDQLPVITALTQQFALFNFWYSSLPGPTWPNRFFVHAATSGGLTDSPDTDQILAGFSFDNGTIYAAIADAGRDWRIYHDGLPQSAGIDSLRLAYVDPFTRHFREMQYFAQDVQDGILPDYTFIEPNYDTGENYENGNSMHPLNDVRKGEALVKSVYEALRNSDYWQDTMLIVTFDEHGGFYDHVSPPAAVPTGDDTRYSNPQHLFAFNRLGVRVPTIVISAYTPKGIVIGDSATDPAAVFDHSSIAATVVKQFSLNHLTERDRAANTLEPAVSLDNPRTDAPLTLPSP